MLGTGRRVITTRHRRGWTKIDRATLEDAIERRLEIIDHRNDIAVRINRRGRVNARLVTPDPSMSGPVQEMRDTIDAQCESRAAVPIRADYVDGPQTSHEPAEGPLAVLLLRRLSHALGIGAIGAVGVLLILDVTDVIEGGWRQSLADAIGTAAFPNWAAWVSALVGVGRAVVGVILTAGQLAPPKKGLTKIYEVHQGFDGETRIRGRAAIRAAFHEMEQIDGVVDVDGRIRAKRLHLNLEIDDRANLTDIENEARRRLDHELWINLGLADFGINLLVTHHPIQER